MTLPLRRPGRALALRNVTYRATTDLASPFWPVRLAEELRDLDADWRESAQVCADAAWAARSAGHSVLHLLSPSQLDAADNGPVTGRTYRHLYLSALRFDFRCLTLQAVVDQFPHSARSLDCYSRALYAFAMLGQSLPEGLALMDEVLGEGGDHAKTLQVLLHGLWLGHYLPGRAERILALAGRPPFRHRTDPIVLFREAGALRQLGRYAEGLKTIDRALDLLPSGDVQVHGDLVRERALLGLASDLEQSIGRISESSGPLVPSDAALDSSASDALAETAVLLDRLAKRDGQASLTAVRRLVEQAAHRLSQSPDSCRADITHRLEWIARRIHGIQRALDDAATSLTSPPPHAPPPRQLL